MKPIIKGMGLAWHHQSLKIQACGRYQHMMIPLQTPGGLQEMLCIPMNKINGWLYSVNPKKVKPELRDKVILYQEESSQVLFEYWNNGKAENPRQGNRIGYFEKKSREFRSLKTIAKDKGLNKKEAIRFAAEKMTDRYGDPEGVFDVSYLLTCELGSKPEDVQLFFDTMDRLLLSGKVLDHNNKVEKIWIHMPTALKTIEEEIGQSFDEASLHSQIKLSDRNIEQKDAKRSKVFKKPIRAWAFSNLRV
ncbi:phage antirepressor N-terminal domain-containing protein [bacterium]|nr:phage antirepressor N-terminal domain-containing protein [bacterium]